MFQHKYKSNVPNLGTELFGPTLVVLHVFFPTDRGHIYIYLSLSCPKQLQPTKQQIQSKIGHVMNGQARQSSPDDLLGVSTRRRAAVDARRNHWDPRYPKIAG